MSDETSDCLGFKDLKLDQWLLDQCDAMGITKPTPAQQHLIPEILNGKNCIGVAQTGSGKTLAYVLPLLQKLNKDPDCGIFILVLAPTKELAAQIADQFKVIGKPIGAEVCLITGRMYQVKQGAELSKRPHIVIATPGRLVDLMESSYDVYFRKIKFLVLDEADKLLGNFDEDLQTIYKPFANAKKQTLLISATLSEKMESAVKVGNNEPYVFVAKSKVNTVDELDQHYVLIPNDIIRHTTLTVLIDYFQKEKPDSSMIVFVKNKLVCQTVHLALNSLGFKNVALNSRLRHKARLASISNFKSNKIRIMVATDLANRGLDIPMVDLVVNLNVPPDPKEYVHRVGRTARAGRKGLALTMMTPREIPLLHAIEEEIKMQLTEFKKVSEKKVLKIALQVEVAFREAAVSLEDDREEEKKQIYRKKRAILDGGEE